MLTFLVFPKRTQRKHRVLNIEAAYIDCTHNRVDILYWGCETHAGLHKTAQYHKADVQWSLCAGDMLDTYMYHKYYAIWCMWLKYEAMKGGNRNRYIQPTTGFWWGTTVLGNMAVSKRTQLIKLGMSILSPFLHIPHSNICWCPNTNVNKNNEEQRLVFVNIKYLISVQNYLSL